MCKMKTAPASSAAGRSLSLFTLVNELPDAVEWAVVFCTDSLLKQISPDQLGAMLGFPARTEICECVAVALTSLGKGLAFDCHGPWTWPLRDPLYDPLYEPGPTIAERLALRLRLLARVEDADCIGFGQLPALSPVVMSLTIDAAGVATAE